MFSTVYYSALEKRERYSHGHNSPDSAERSLFLCALDRKLQFPLAMKMMFNYEFSSREDRILREMGNELVPVMDKSVRGLLRRDQRPADSSHPNVVEIYTAFVDTMPILPRAEELYPSALPFDVFPDGLGRSRTMFIVMRRYSMTLFEYLVNYRCGIRTGQICLGQLLEALVYLAQQKISHRDMKSNNILVDFDDPTDAPRLVLSDFGCCLSNGDDLQLDYPHSNVDLGATSPFDPRKLGVRNRAEPGE